MADEKKMTLDKFEEAYNNELANDLGNLVQRLATLASKNNIVLGEALQRYGQVELIVVLTSCIGIVLAIPISMLISTPILKPSKKRRSLK